MTKTKEAAAWELTAERLRREGWEVRCRRVWLAEARRGTHLEQGIGSGRDEAMAEVVTQTLLDRDEGCP
jgi:hypothetical protein